MQEWSPVDQEVVAEAIRFHQAGRLDEAAQLCQQVLTLDPYHAGVLHLLGRIAYQKGFADTSADMLRKAIAVNAAEASYHSHLGNALSSLGKLEEAEASYRRALLLKPDYAEAQNNLGNALFEQGHLDEAVACYRQALTNKDEFAGAHNNLGTAFAEQGNLDEAVNSFRQALALEPDFMAARVNLGNALFDQGNLDEAVACHRQMIALQPDDVEAYGNLGIALWEQGNYGEAEAVYRRCLQINPNDICSLNNLASLLLAKGDATAALRLIRQSLNVEETRRAKALFVEIVQQLPLIDENDEIQILLIRALDEPWARPSKLAQVSAGFVKRDPKIGACVTKANQAWHEPLSASELFESDDPAALAEDRLLHALLCSAPNVDLELERLLTITRSLMLESALTCVFEDKFLGYYSALACQCFINEYVFFHTKEEIHEAQKLRDLLTSAIDSGLEVPALWVLAVAAYFPLHSLPFAARLLDRQWPESVTEILVQQIREPHEQQTLLLNIPRLTRIEDEISRLVRDQYEQNPYPRWVKLPSPDRPTNIAVYLSRKFPLAPFRRRGANGTTEILVAGCGTGQQSIAAAQRTSNADVLAIDLSLSSLAYALRKTQELGLTSIEHGQADILELGSLGRQFDVIECSGVLHHMAEPWTGLRTLLSLLRPDGFMRLGFYSEIARRDIIKAQNFIAQSGYKATADQIRICRQEIMEKSKQDNFATVVGAEDFFSLSNCRDLLFHVHEHRMTLADIDNFLQKNGLIFLGFELEHQDAISGVYKQRFPDDPGATNLAHWQTFENEHPELFFRTYQFWVQKVG